MQTSSSTDGEIIFGVLSGAGLIGALFVFSSAFGQAGNEGKLNLLTLSITAVALWITKILAPAIEVGLSFSAFLILAGYCIAGVLTITSFMAFILEWRLVHPFKAIGTWMMIMVSSQFKQAMISKMAALLIFLVPNRNGGLGWQTPEEFVLLEEAGKVEREGAEWRSVILVVLTLFLTLISLNLVPLITESIQEQLLPPYAKRFLLLISSANPATILIYVLVLCCAWGILLEIWLSEIANRIISLASIHARQLFIGPKRDFAKVFENYRIVKINNPISLEKAERSRWTLIAKAQINGKWICLVERRSWLGSNAKNDPANHTESSSEDV